MKILDPKTGETVYLNAVGNVIEFEMARLAIVARRNAQALARANEQDDPPVFDNHDVEPVQFDDGA